MRSFLLLGRLAVRNLRRGGQRVLVALLCIMFGTLSLVSLTAIAKSIERSLLLEPAELLGGDMSLVRKAEDTLRPEHVGQLEALQRAGAIRSFTLIAYDNLGIAFQSAGSQEVHSVGLGMGIQPESYPQAGSLTIEQPGSTGLRTLLQQVGDVVVTSDLAFEYHLEPGDPIVLFDLRAGGPVPGTVRGIATDTPNHQGDKMYYTTETAAALAGGRPAINTVIVNTDQPEALTGTLESSGWSVDWVALRYNGGIGNLWMAGLRIAGLLGLLVAGVGAANTMQVLLRRRQREIAIWKTLGYTEGRLRLMFSLEAGLLGLAGSAVGAGLGVLIAGPLLELMRRSSSVLYRWTFSPVPPLVGVLAGTLTTVIFAYAAISAAGRVRPAMLLRHDPAGAPRLPAGESAALVLLLAVPFCAVTSLVMGSLPAGAGALAALACGLAVLGGAFRLLLWAWRRVAQLLLRRHPIAGMALNDLQRREAALVFAMIALFVGVLAMSTGLVVAEFGQIRGGAGIARPPVQELAALVAADPGTGRQPLSDAELLPLVAEYRTARGYQKALVVPMIMAALAMLGGFLLIANSASLAMLDRRYEIGVLKAVGYSRGRVLSLLMVEYGSVGLLAGGAGVLFIEGLLAVLSLATGLPAAILLLSLPSLVPAAACSTGLTLLIVCAIAWKPSQAAPLAVLNERE